MVKIAARANTGRRHRERIASLMVIV